MKKDQHPNNTGILALNKTMLATMPRALRSVAEIAVSDPLAVTRMTVEELASRAKCSEGTVIRWCKVLGFSGFQELKLSLVFDAALREKTSTLSNYVSSNHALKNHSVFTSVHAALDTTEQLLNQEYLEKAAHLIMKAKSILIVGVGASANVGKYLQYRLLRAGISSDFHSDMHTGLMAASILDERSVLIAVSNSGSNLDINEVAQCAVHNKSSTIGLTNHPRSRLTKTVDITLLAGSSSDYPLAGGSALSVITQISIIECLFETIITLDPSREKAVVRTAESVLKRLY